MLSQVVVLLRLGKVDKMKIKVCQGTEGNCQVRHQHIYHYLAKPENLHHDMQSCSHGAFE